MNRSSVSRSTVISTLVFVGAGLIAAISGVIAASGVAVLQLLFLGLVTGGLLLLLPLSPLVIFMLTATFFLQGLITYFLRIQQAAWLPYLVCLLIGVKLIDFGRRRTEGHNANAPQTWNSAPMLWLALYLFCLMSAAVVNAPALTQVVIGLKNALPIWIAAGLIYTVAKQPNAFSKMWRLFNLIFFAQLPLVLYQHFVIMPRRRDVANAADAVVGSFGGLIDAGGANSTLVLFAVMVMTYHLALWARDQESGLKVTLYGICGLIIIFSGEVKAVLLWLPLAVIYTLRRRIMASPMAAMLSLTGTCLLIGGLVAAYSIAYWQDWHGGASGRDTSLESRIGYFFDARNINYRTGEISRGASLALWANDSSTDIVHRLVGYGPGASRISNTGGLGEIARRFAPLWVSATSLAMMLWDIGLLGCVAFIALLICIFLWLHRVTDSAAIEPREQAQAEGLAVTVVIFLSLLLYNHSLNDEPSVQMLLSIALGCALYWRKSILQTRRAPKVSAGGTA